MSSAVGKKPIVSLLLVMLSKMQYSLSIFPMTVDNCHQTMTPTQRLNFGADPIDCQYHVEFSIASTDVTTQISKHDKLIKNTERIGKVAGSAI